MVVGLLVGSVRLRVQNDVVGGVVQRAEPHHSVDGELPSGDIREQERRGLHQVRAQVRRAVNLGADHELDAGRPGGQDAGPEQVDRTQQRVGEDAVRGQQQDGLPLRLNEITLLGWVWAGADWRR